jgi:hypothetical protein
MEICTLNRVLANDTDIDCVCLMSDVNTLFLIEGELVMWTHLWSLGPEQSKPLRSSCMPYMTQRDGCHDTQYIRIMI